MGIIKQKMSRKWPHTYENYDCLPEYYRARRKRMQSKPTNTDHITRIKATEEKMIALSQQYSGRTIRCTGVKYHRKGEKKGQIVRMEDE